MCGARIALPIRASNLPNGKMYYTDDSTSERDLLMLAITALWHTDVKFLFHEMSEDSWRHGVVGAEFRRNVNVSEVNPSISNAVAAVFLLTGIVPSDSPLNVITQIWHQNGMFRPLMLNINLVLCGYADEDISRAVHGYKLQHQNWLRSLCSLVMDLMDMLDDENVTIRETAKDTLGIEMHSHLFPTLLQQMD
ncbi:hypothetical protein AURDEDRAFT_130216 [Auricularia subglabra TFB-10046 SS5]|uniref:Uncharacterized protein n=1 Tax=Auricularia subglabra (strain TFB-10046 / SS5) TaxID=717982 RepID=J0CY71_AURST|nr:hypothetical protein AURDEDRAFT_130216 [Auricularia subglabra TFB-10046 SS5]